MGDDPEKLDLYERIIEKFRECKTPDGKVLTVKFGEAALMMAPVYEWIFGVGVVSKHLKNDIVGHATGVLDSAGVCVENATVDGLISTTLQHRTHDQVRSDSKSGIVEILWTKRSLDFILRFLDYGLVRHTDESLQRCASMAYTQVLKPYHSLMVSGIVTLALSLTPTREMFLSNLGFGCLTSAQKVLQKFLTSALPIVEYVDKTLLEHNCNFPNKA